MGAVLDLKSLKLDWELDVGRGDDVLDFEVVEFDIVSLYGGLKKIG